jgi:glycosyltransferase involved in cell wall biosynthesis
LKVLYVTSNGGIHDYRFLKKLVEDYEVLLLHYTSRKLTDDIKELKNLKIISRKPIVRSLPVLSELLHFRKVYRNFKPDIVHTGYVWQVGILASFFNVPHHLSMPWGSDILFQPEKHFLIKMIVKKVLNQCNHIHCDAEFVKEKIISDYNIPAEKISVFPRGVDLKLFSPLNKTECRKQLGIPEDKFVILFNRHLEPVYGINTLLKGYKKFASKKDDVLLLMVSSGSLKGRVARFIKENRLDTKMVNRGNIPNKRMPLHLGAADVYLSTSISDGSSLSLLEAMAMGLGLVVTDANALRYWVKEDNGILVQRNSSSSIAGALEEYYNDRQLIKKHGEKNTLIAEEKADWDKNYSKLKEIYRQMLERSQGGTSGEA